MKPGPSWWRAAAGAGALLLLFTPSAAAGMAVSPLKREVVIKPGETQEVRINVSNPARGQGDAPCSASLEVTDFAVTERGGLIFQKAGSRSDSASPWVSMAKTRVKLAPGESDTVECLIRVPRHASGEYYSAVMVTLDSPARGPGGVGICYRIASGLFVTVPGRPLAKKAEVVRCEVLWPSAQDVSTTGCLESVPAEHGLQATRGTSGDWPAPVGALGDSRPALPRLVAVLANTGDARFDASGQARIRWPDGRVVLRAPLWTERACVQAGDTRLFGCPLQKPLVAGEYLVEVDFSYQSAWGKARMTLPLSISEAQAAVLAGAAGRGPPPPGAGPAVQVTPEVLAAKAPPGALRTLRVAVRNAGEAAAHCQASWQGEGPWPIPAAWLTLDSGRFVLERGRSKSLALTLQVPADAAGIHRGVVAVHVESNREVVTKEVPVEVTVSSP
ncbi:MAG: hypothetical protein FJ288_12060 [Planctomycetes bacterium]|nr:hypothetical protein [Planctomycetota bacterium]